LSAIGVSDLLKARRRRRLGLAIAALLAVLAHGVVVAGITLLSDEQKAALERRLSLSINIKKPKPKPKKKKEPEKPKPKPKPKKKKRRKIDFTKKRRTKPKPLEKPPEEPPPPVFGVSLSSTSSTGTGITVSVGNTLAIDPSKSKRVKPKPFRPTPTQELSTRPKLTNGAMRKLQSLPYPQKAMDMDLEGRVLLQLDIDEKGRVMAVRVLKDPGADLGAAAKKMFKSIRFIPATVNGEPVASRVRFKYDFVIEF